MGPAALLTTCVLAARALAAPAGGTAWSGSAAPRIGPAVSYAAPLPPSTGPGRLAYLVVRGEDGKPLIRPGALFVTRVAFAYEDLSAAAMIGYANDFFPWPVAADTIRTWDPTTNRFRTVRVTDPPEPGDVGVLHGTVHVKGLLAPRLDVWPTVSVWVESGTVSLPLDVKVRLEDRDRRDLSGLPVFTGTLSTTPLADGLWRLRISGGWRDLDIDGDPETPAFEPGGDAGITFRIRNASTRRATSARTGSGGAASTGSAGPTRPGPARTGRP